MTVPASPAESGTSARLLRMGAMAAVGRRGAPNEAREIARGSVEDLVEMVREDDAEELWRYTLILDGGEYVRNAELRALVRR